MNIIEQLTDGEENIKWEDLALCKDIIYEVVDEIGDPFYEGYEQDEFVAKAVDEMCNNCFVQKACGKYAKRNKEPGVWGGIYWSNGRPDRVNNRHKTPRDWEKLRKIFGRL